MDSRRRGCRSRRTVELYFERKHSRHLRDVDVSSRNGYWAMTADARAAPKRFLVKVTRKALQGQRRHHLVCSGDRFAHKITRPSPSPG